jgi:hypothetical protein
MSESNSLTEIVDETKKTSSSSSQTSMFVRLVSCRSVPLVGSEEGCKLSLSSSAVANDADSCWRDASTLHVVHHCTKEQCRCTVSRNAVTSGMGVRCFELPQLYVRQFRLC